MHLKETMTDTFTGLLEKLLGRLWGCASYVVDSSPKQKNRKTFFNAHKLAISMKFVPKKECAFGSDSVMRCLNALNAQKY